ncbi:DMT family transporter [Bacillus cereus group sp. TH260-2LC]|uniref:DMT family transporter n=1 Tax=unclassified Bacillus cereus group TaxID=2750818 RepID=UPI0022E8159B|nr:multidrug efflux SMR transporter [Bacillus cereus group sp. TH260-2LC]MDA1530277.1 multidrug efflux SMR transporter [Bacillus cereus group sp. TH260-2LC]
MQWIYLCLAILFEVAGTTAMKLSDGLTKLVPSILIFVFYVVSFAFLSFALKGMEMSVAYAVWSGMGIVTITTIGFIYFGESINIIKILAILFILVGVVILNFNSAAHEAKKKEMVEERIH